MPWAARLAADQGKGAEVVVALEPLSTDPLSVFSDSAKQQAGAADLAQAMPAGSVVSIDESSWSPNGIGGGTILVTVTAPDGPPAQYLALVSSYDGGWKIDATLPSTPVTAVKTS